jgi:hypothetical protein
MGSTLSSDQDQKPRERRITQRGGYNREIDWYLTERARMMGERSTFGGVVASIEKGGSGGCKGTKGVGVLRVEPFTNCKCDPDAKDGGCGLCGCTALHRAFGRATACEMTWRRLGLVHQWRLAGRYAFSREKLPPGLYGQLGDLSGVAFVCAFEADEAAAGDAAHVSQVTRLIAGAAKKSALKWAENQAAKALVISHSVWDLERAEVAALLVIGGNHA